MTDAPKLCVNCRWHFSNRVSPSQPQEICRWEPETRFDPVYGDVMINRDARQFRKNSYGTGGRRAQTNCGVNAERFEPKPTPPKMNKWHGLF